MPTYIAEKQVRFGQLQAILEANAAKGWELVSVTAESEFYTTVWKVPSDKEGGLIDAGVPARESAATGSKPFDQPDRRVDEQKFASHLSAALTAEAHLDLIKRAIRDELSRVEIHVELRTSHGHGQS